MYAALFTMSADLVAYK